MLDGVASSNQAKITNDIVNYYENVLLEQFFWRPRLDEIAFDILGGQEIEHLKDHLRSSRSDKY